MIVSVIGGAFAGVTLMGAALAAPLQPARTEAGGRRLPEEAAAAARMNEADCKTRHLLWPGLLQLCTGREAEGRALAWAGAAEGAATAALWSVHGLPNSEAGLDGRWSPFVMWQNGLLYSYARVGLDTQLASATPYTPRDDLSELMRAPFSGQVLRRPSVWAGTLVMVGGAAALTFGVDEASVALDRPTNLFGLELQQAAGAPLFLATDMVLMEHVAIGEEIVFRGLLQSELVRRTGPAGGWALGTLLFGGLHASNALFLPEAERRDYLLYSLPYIMAAGSWLGATYHLSDYSLAPSVAVHFWYNVSVSALDYVLHPEQNLFSIRVGGEL